MNSRYTGRRKTSPYDPPLSTALAPNRRNLTRLIGILAILLCGSYFLLRGLGGSNIKDRTSRDAGRVIARDWEAGKYAAGESTQDKKGAQKGTGANEMPVRGRGWKAMANKLNPQTQEEVVLASYLLLGPRSLLSLHQ